MNGSYRIWDSISGLFASVQQDSHKLIGVGLVLTTICLFFSITLSCILFILTACTAHFFRDPKRVTPLREGLIISPADGRVASIEKVIPPPELSMLGKERIRISIFSSLFDMHISRAPASGFIKRSVYVPGSFLRASNDKSSEDNERRGLVIETPSGSEIAVLQIAGMLTQRIVTFFSNGDTIGVGQRFGLIRLGSRIDIYLPEGHSSHVSIGQLMIAGETVIADLKSAETERETRRC